MVTNEMGSEMKYKDVLGKNFKNKQDAYKHFQSLRNQTPLGKNIR